MAHLSSKQYDKTVDDLTNLGFLSPALTADPANRAVIAPAIAATLEVLYGSGGGMSEAKIDKLRAQSRVAVLSEELKALSRQYPLRLPPYFLLILRAFSTLEGLGLNVDNSFAILDECWPYVARRLLTDDTPRVQAALRSFAFGASDRLSVDRVELIAQGLRAFGTTMDNTSRRATAQAPTPRLALPQFAAQAQSSALVALPVTPPAFGLGFALDSSSREVLHILLEPKGSFLQSLLLEEAVRFSDALSRDAILQLLTAAPLRALLQRAGGPAASLLLPLWPSAASFGPIRLTRDDEETLATLRRLSALFTDGTLPPAQLVQLPGSAAELQAEGARLVAAGRAASALLPEFAPGLASLTERFARLLLQRLLQRATEDLAGASRTVGGGALVPAAVPSAR